MDLPNLCRFRIGTTSMLGNICCVNDNSSEGVIINKRCFLFEDVVDMLILSPRCTMTSLAHLALPEDAGASIHAKSLLWTDMSYSYSTPILVCSVSDSGDKDNDAIAALIASALVLLLISILDAVVDSRWGDDKWGDNRWRGGGVLSPVAV